jgi:hypothetical protein
MKHQSNIELPGQDYRTYQWTVLVSMVQRRKDDQRLDTEQNRKETYSSATSSIMNVTWSHPELNSGFRSEKWA